MRRALLLAAGWMLWIGIASPLKSAPRYEWYFQIEEGLASFFLQPFAVDRPARIEVYIEWFPVADLEAILYSPGRNRPLRGDVSRGWIRWQLTTDEAYPWKGLWRIYLRSASPGIYYRGRITVFLDYTYKSRTQAIPPEELPPPTGPKGRPAPEKWGLRAIEVALDESAQRLQFRVRLRLPADLDRSGLIVQLRSPSGALKVQEALQLPPDPSDMVEPASRSYPVFLGTHCVQATLEGLTPGIDREAWQERFEQCFRIRCEPSVRIRTLQVPPPSAGTGIETFELVVDPERLQVRPAVQLRLPESGVPAWHLSVRSEDEALPLQEAWNLQTRQARWVGRAYPIPLGRHCATAELTGTPLPEGLTVFPACFQIQCSPTTRLETVAPEKSPL
ncbi:MAG: hypothetical protein NZ742_01905 [Acidobacteria bacterium]|nr:hypothetical protein [Acidobacteriota bacterium]MDW7983602.1 hypothetical protein [Acidobacteriota bacterium]